MTTRDDIIWLAGIIDGEGCIFLQKRSDYAVRSSGANRTGYTRIEIRCALRVSMAHHPTIDRVAAHLRDLVADPERVKLQLENRKTNRTRRLKNAIVTSRESVRPVLQAILPFLFTKKAEAQLSLLYMARACGHVRYRATEYDALLAELATDLRHGRGEARTQEFLRQVIPSQAEGSEAGCTSEGVETRSVRIASDKPTHERPASSPIEVVDRTDGEIVRTSGESRSAA